MSNKKQTPLQFLSKLLTNKIDKYKQLKTDVPIQELIRFKTDLLLLIEEEKKQIIDSYYAGTAQFDNSAQIVNPKTAEDYYTETYLKNN